MMADAVLTVNGVKVEKSAARLTFDVDNVIVTFGDDSTSRYDMEEISFTFLPSAGMESIKSFGTLTVSAGERLEISGISEGCALQVFDLQGKLSARATSSGGTCEIDISHLEAGAYILKAGNEIVKFIKR